MASVPPDSDGPSPFTRRAFVQRVGGTVVGASFLSLLDGHRSFPLAELA